VLTRGERPLDLSQARLTHTTFGDGAFLGGATFGDEADLGWATFGDEANLGEATFGDRADLGWATFGDGANLSGATFGVGADLSGATFGVGADLSGATFGDGADLSGATFGGGVSLSGVWFVGSVDARGAVFVGQQRGLGPLYAGGTVDLYDAQFGSETRLEVDAAGLVLSRAVFGGAVEVRVVRARVEASETRFEARATFGALDAVRRPQLEGRRGRRGRKLVQAVAAPASVWSLRRTDVASLTIVGIDVDDARFAGARGLERLRLIDTAFEERQGRQRLREESLLDEPDDAATDDERRMGHPSCTAEQVAELYRALRKSREDNADTPGGNDLYVGEQLMRRRALRERERQTAATRARRVLLALYGAIGGYGVRPARPLAGLLGVVALAWPLAACWGLSTGDASDALVFVLRSMLLLPNSHNALTTTAGDALQVALRVIGPVLISLVALGVRAQIKR
jgi:uncharacterized protein YjbI with pentapeptide repeats